MNAMHDWSSLGCSKERAAHVSVLAFRCAWADKETRERALAKALEAYLNLRPKDQDAADKVIEALVDAIRHRPHWVNDGG